MAFIKPQSAETPTEGLELDLKSGIFLPLFEQKGLLLGRSELFIRLIPNTPDVYMMCNNSIRITKVEFMDACLYFQRSKLAPNVLEGHRKALNFSPTKYPIRESFVVPITVSKGIMDTIIDNVHNGQLPKRAFVAFVDNNAFNGSTVLNPYNYQNFNLSYLAFSLDGTQHPHQAFEPNFDKKLYVREFSALFEATNQDSTDNCIEIDRQSYIKGNNIFAVNFSPELGSGCCSSGYANPVKYGSIRLHVKFRTPLAKTITILVYLDYDALIQIDHERNSIYDSI